MSEYNQIASEFAKDLRNYANKNALKIKVRSTKENISIKKIITGAKSRELFKRYLNAFPTSYHPLDIERLDIFTCSLARYAKKRIDLDLLRGWLVEHESWSSKDAERCTRRIEVGLAVLKANRKI